MATDPNRGPMDLDYAFDVANRMGALDEFPRAAAAIGQIARQILAMCPRKEQAKWLLDEVTISGRHTKWEGPGWLRQVFAECPIKPPEAKPKVPPQPCGTCGGSGWRTVEKDGVSGSTRCGCGTVPPAAGEGWTPPKDATELTDQERAEIADLDRQIRERRKASEPRRPSEPEVRELTADEKEWVDSELKRLGGKVQ